MEEGTPRPSIRRFSVDYAAHEPCTALGSFRRDDLQTYVDQESKTHCIRAPSV
jgi:hypothetical protein